MLVDAVTSNLGGVVRQLTGLASLAAAKFKAIMIRVSMDWMAKEEIVSATRPRESKEKRKEKKITFSVPWKC